MDQVYLANMGEKFVGIGVTSGVHPNPLEELTSETEQGLSIKRADGPVGPNLRWRI
jgi:hypothetical protein